MSLLLEDFAVVMRVSITGEIGVDDHAEPTRRVIHNMAVLVGKVDITAELSESALQELEAVALDDP